MDTIIKQLESQVAELTAWKNARTAERLSFPLDISSRTTLNKGTMVFTGRTGVANIQLFTDLLGYGMEVAINGKKRVCLVTVPLNVFTVVAATDIFTNVSGAHNLQNGDQIAVVSNSLLPAPLSTTTTYYIINRTGTTFQVSTTSGGSAVNVTTTGLGTHYYGKIS